MSFANQIDDLLRRGVDEGTNILNSNKAINPIKKFGKFVLGESDTVGIRGVANFMAKEDGLKDAVKKAYTVGGDLKTPNYKAIAGTYVGASLGARALSGGGIYRDSTGEANLPGVPFI